MKTFNLLFIGILILFSSKSFGQSAKAYTKAIKKHRKGYKKDFVKEERSPLEKSEVKYLRFYPANEAYKIKADFSRTPEEKPFMIQTSSGKEKKYVKYGELSFYIDSQQVTLAVYQSLKLISMPQYKDYLFIPFKDATNGTETYGGGRYLDINIGAIKNGKVFLDFNKAYNPYCAFASSGYSCPIPPKENHLKIAIKAGEMQFAGDKH